LHNVALVRQAKATQDDRAFNSETPSRCVQDIGSLTGIGCHPGYVRFDVRVRANPRRNPVLASLDPATGKPVGVSVDLATEFARRLGVPLQLVAVDSAGASVENVSQGKADIGFFAVDPKRGQEIAFTRPYVLIEGFYLVRNTSPITTNGDVDQPGVTVAVGKGSAYDLFLTRELHRATLVRIPTSPAVVQSFLDQHLDVAAGVKQQLEKDAAQAGGMRILDQRFMVIRQAMGVPKARGDEAAAYLSKFVEDMKVSGFVSASLARHHIEGAAIPNDNE
jgi:polar amino acid transport system substrate-binding protein